MLSTGVPLVAEKNIIISASVDTIALMIIKSVGLLGGAVLCCRRASLEVFRSLRFFSD